nr:ATP-binding cassette domain-containing protein [Comamonas testosteroni]
MDQQQYSMQAWGLGTSFGPRVILAEVDFALPVTGVTALLGPAGTGKSTMLRTLAGLNDSNPRFRRWGKVQIGGQPLTQNNRPQLVQQHARLMRANTLDALIEMARQREQRSPLQWREWVIEQLQKYGFAELIHMLDKPTMELSSAP